MGAFTKIGWTSGPNGEPGHTLNVWRGCSEAQLPDGEQHAGCLGCYARDGYGTRYGISWGPVHLGGTRDLKAASGWDDFIRLARRAAGLGHYERVFTMSLGDVLEEVLVPPSVDWEGWPTLTQEQAAAAVLRGEGFPLYAHPDASVRGPERERLIVHAQVTAAGMVAARVGLWDVLRYTARLCGHCGGSTWEGGYEAAERLGLPLCTRCPNGERMGGFTPLLLTKRPERWPLVPFDVRGFSALGASISDQPSAEAMLPELLASEGFALRFVSVEPLVGPVDFSRFMPTGRWWLARCRNCNHIDSTERFLESSSGDDADVVCPKCFQASPDDLAELDWVITGGESGRGDAPRPFHLDHARSLVQQSLAAEVPVFVKQMGSLPVMAEEDWGSWVAAGRTPPLSVKNARRAPEGMVPLAFTGKGEDAREWAHLFGLLPEQLQQVPTIHTTLGVR